MKIAIIIAAIVGGVAKLVEVISDAVAKHREPNTGTRPRPSATVEKLRAKAEEYRKKAQ